MKSEQSAATLPENNIDIVPIGLLVPHPDNPRKDLGDLTELAENIRVNGVLQNLTVVPAPDSDWNRYAPMNQIDAPRFRVVIGHRRLAAARLAGLTELPCVIAEKMTPEEQIAVMLSENIQRQALTPYEEAKGFQQLQIDFGKSPKEIAELAGFHETTVRSRLKLAELDGKKVEKGLRRGATLYDFEELNKLESPEAREECLEAIGTNNFKNKLKEAKEEADFKRRFAQWEELTRSFAVALNERPESKFLPGGACVYLTGDPPLQVDYHATFSRYTRDADVKTPEDADTVKYYCYVGDGEIRLYKEHIVDEEAEAARRLEAEKTAEWNARGDRIKAISRRHYELRRDFVKDYGAAKSHAAVIIRDASNLILRFFIGGRTNEYYRCPDVRGLFREFFDTEIDDDAKAIRTLHAMYSQYPEKTLLIMAFWMAENGGQSYFKQGYNSAKRRYESWYKNNGALDQIYYLLEELGYQISDEEKQFQRGEHPLFDEEPVREEG